ncbi:hypothetical protein [Heliorestis convoluta]|uniref:Uncharacterized protein n=1 Tax=Heliorestis convoluta TaxID=356322 RepID=A0A5Q2N2F5_9FIRM|nr:hypothetical protein [Heliorestis convoluta]QGG47776.1 hypothetical protein FTV88_1677 [Heliorestis convoluta]
MDRKKIGRLLTLVFVFAFAAVFYFAFLQERNPHGNLEKWEVEHGDVVLNNQNPERFCYQCHVGRASYCNQCHDANNIQLEIPLPE